MNFELSDEQLMLREAAAGVLGRSDGVGAARAARDGVPLPDLWADARDAGWTGLLIAEQHGGSGLALFDAMLVLEQCGRRLAAAGLLGHLVATRVLDRAARAGDARAAAELPALAAGDARAAIILARPPVGNEDWSVEAPGPGGRRGPLPEAQAAAEGLRLTGAAGYQLDVAGADLLVIPAAGGGTGPRLALARAGAPGLELESIMRGDGTRPLAHLRADGAEVTPLRASEADAAEAWHFAQALLAAEAVGVCDATLDMATAYAKDRHAFGRPIGSYQAVKHQLVEILRQTEQARNLCYFAGFAAEHRPDELALAAACARYSADRAADYATRTSIAVHGGIGATWEHDAPFYWRRAQLGRRLLGGVAGAGDRVATEIVARVRTETTTTEETV